MECRNWCYGVAAGMLWSSWLPGVHAQGRVFEGKTVLFGNLHAHSKLSDDISNAGDDMLPIRAFEYADEHGLDFLAITDHQKADDTNPRYSMTTQEYKDFLFNVAKTYNQNHLGAFIAIPGIEWGTTATGNHVNVFGASDLPPDTIKDKDYDELYAWAKANAEFAQFNHPYSWAAESNRNLQVGNFGQALYPSTDAFRDRANSVVKTCSIISTVAGGHINGEFSDSEAKTHRDMSEKGFRHWLGFLNMGFHVSPAANQDTHGKNWGTVTAARTAVWADSFGYDDLMRAIRTNRVYATEDDELAVVLQVEFQGQKYWMGETVPLGETGADVDLLVTVWQTSGSDGDSTEEGPYSVTIYKDSDGIGGQKAAALSAVSTALTAVTKRIPIEVVPDEYVFIEITEQGGRDNPIGDGEDEVANATGSHGADGKRDDMNDSAWTSPVWFQLPAPASFVWSAKSESKVYHNADCWAVGNIGSANRRTGTPPPGWTKHTCHPGA